MKPKIRKIEGGWKCILFSTGLYCERHGYGTTPLLAYENAIIRRYGWD